jgi:hypothetical protein
MMTTDEMIEHIKTMGDFDEVLLENTGELLGSFKCTQSASNFGTTVNVFAYGEDTAKRYSYRYRYQVNSISLGGLYS